MVETGTLIRCVGLRPMSVSSVHLGTYPQKQRFTACASGITYMWAVTAISEFDLHLIDIPVEAATRVVRVREERGRCSRLAHVPTCTSLESCELNVQPDWTGLDEQRPRGTAAAPCSTIVS